LTSFQLHGTYRQKDRIYNEETFFGQGKSIKDASEDELKQDLTERVSENPLAYSGNKLHFELTEEEIMQKKAL
jgi:lathosterol oxidase